MMDLDQKSKVKPSSLSNEIKVTEQEGQQEVKSASQLQHYN